MNEFNFMLKLNFSSDLYTFYAGFGGWLVLKMELMLTQFSTKLELKLKLSLATSWD